MKTKHYFGLIICMFIVLFFNACKKEENLADDIEATNDNSFAEAAYNDISSIADQAGAENALATYQTDAEGSLLSKCASLTETINGNTHILTIDFGPVDCVCRDGKIRRGKILISYTGFYRDSGSIHTITFDHYFVNSFKIEGSKTVTNLGHNANGNLNYSIQVNGKITNPASQTLLWNSTRNREWISGENTKGVFGLFDDIYSITGSSTGSSFNGIPFTSNISEPLIIALNCRWIKQGKFEFTPGTSAIRYFDFGLGNCDNKASVTINGTTYPIILR